MSAAPRLPCRLHPVPWRLLLAVNTAPLLLFPNWAPAATAAALLLLLLTYRQPPPTPLDIPLLLYLALSTVSVLVSPLPVESLPHLLALFLGINLYTRLVSFLGARPSCLYPAVRLLALGGVLLAVGSLFILEWPARTVLDLSLLTTNLPHLSGRFALNYNTAAGLLLLLLPLVAAGWHLAVTPWQRLLAGAAGATILLTLLLTQSRNAWLAILVAAGGSVLWRQRRFWPLLLLALCLLLLPFVVAWSPESGALWSAIDRLDSASKAGPAADQSWVGRVEMWQAAIRMMGDYPSMGAGLFSFDAVSRANYVYQAVHPTFPISHAHNFFLQAGAGLGWAGWYTATLLWLSLLYILWQANHRAPDRFRLLGQVLGFSVLACLSFNTFDLLALEQPAGALLWLLLGLAAAYAGLAGVRFGRRQRIVQATPLVLLLLLLPALPRTLAHLNLNRIRLAGTAPENLAPAQMGDPRRQGLVYYLQGSRELALKRWTQDSEASSFLLNQGQQAYYKAQPQAALDWYDLALALEPAATIYYWRGAAHEALGHDRRALADYRRVVELSAGERHYGLNLEAAAWEQQGRLLVARNEWEGARDAFARAVALAPNVVDYRRQVSDVEQMLDELETAP